MEGSADSDDAAIRTLQDDKVVQKRIQRIRDNDKDVAWKDVAAVFTKMMAKDKARDDLLAQWQREQSELILQLNRKVGKLREKVRRLETDAGLRKPSVHHQGSASMGADSVKEAEAGPTPRAPTCGMLSPRPSWDRSTMPRPSLGDPESSVDDGDESRRTSGYKWGLTDEVIAEGDSTSERSHGADAKDEDVERGADTAGRRSLRNGDSSELLRGSDNGKEPPNFNAGRRRSTASIDSMDSMASGGTEDLKTRLEERVSGVMGKRETMGSMLTSQKGMDVTPQLLDIGDTYSAESSIWDGLIGMGTPAVGTANSLILFCVWALNIGGVILFLFCIEEVFGDDDGISSEILDGLLKFRLGVAHSADFADKVTRRSMARQVCDGELKLHLAGAQHDMYQDLDGFKRGGWLSKALMVLVQFFWAAIILKEFEYAFSFFAALTRVPKSSVETNLMLVDLRSDDIEGYQQAIDGLPKKEGSAFREFASVIKKAPASINWSSRGSVTSSMVAATGSTSTDVPADARTDSAASPDDTSSPDGDDVVLVPQAPMNDAEFLMMKTIRVQTMYWPRYVFLVAFACIPRVVLAGCLYWTGARWLAKTISLGDLILNSIALEFVLQFSTILYEIAAPRRVKTMVNNLEAMPIHSKRVSGATWEISKAIVKTALMVGLMVGVTTFYLMPIFNQLDQAEAVICSGQMDFIYATNPATGMVHVTRTVMEPAEDFTDVEQVVAQVAQVDLSEDGGWGDYRNDKVFEASQSGFTRAVLTPAAESFLEAVESPQAFAEIIQMSVWSMADATRVLPCEDLAGGQSRAASLEMLRQIVKNNTIQGCDDVAEERCAEMNLPELRAICPKRCGCELAIGNSVGFFGTPQFGCPAQCETFKSATNEIYYRRSWISMTGYDFAADDESRLLETCSDTSPDSFSFPGGCSDADDDGSRSDLFLRTCNSYWGTQEYCDHGPFDDADFTALHACCACGGGNKGVPSSLDCWDDWTQDCWLMPAKARSWLLYLQGLFSFSLSQPGFNLTLRNVIEQDYAGLNTTERAATLVSDDAGRGCVDLRTRTNPWLNENTSDALFEHITSRALGRALANGTWEIMPGKPHPRHTNSQSGEPLQGCDFLASYELTSLLNIDLCNPSDKTSIKFFCPEACGCSPSSALSECPAACIFTDCTVDTCRHVHPWFSGVDSISEVQEGVKADCCENTDNGTKSEGEFSCAFPALDPDGQQAFNWCWGCYDDSDFTAALMCCGCQGGTKLWNDLSCFDNAVDCPIESAAEEQCGTNGYPDPSLCCTCGGGQSEPMLSWAYAVLDVDFVSMSQNSSVVEAVKSSLAELMADECEPAGVQQHCTPPPSVDVRLSPAAEVAGRRLSLGALVVQITLNTHARIPDVHFRVWKLMDGLTAHPSFLGRMESAIEGIVGMDCCLGPNVTAERVFYWRGNATGMDELENVNVTLFKQEQEDCECDCGEAAQSKFQLTCKDIETPNNPHCLNGYGDDSDFTAAVMCCACLEERPCEDMEEGALNSKNKSCAWSYFLDSSECGMHDDSDFTASTICCDCGGGAPGGVWPTVAPTPVPTSGACDVTDGSRASGTDTGSFPCFCGDKLCGANEICTVSDGIGTCDLAPCDKNDGSGWSTAYPCFCFQERGAGRKACTTYQVCHAEEKTCALVDPCLSCVNPTTGMQDGCFYSEDYAACVNANEDSYCAVPGAAFTGPVVACHAVVFDAALPTTNPTPAPTTAPTLPFWLPPEVCLDLDGRNTDRRGRSCTTGYYVQDNPDHHNFGSIYYCGMYDDDDFTSSEMCCACTGGLPGYECQSAEGSALDSYGYNCMQGYTVPGYCGTSDDTDFTSTDMCCQCAGGSLVEGR